MASKAESKGQWFAIKTAPGAQLPRREYVIESTSLDREGRARGKGYRIVPDINHDLSAIERALDEAGFAYYMPTEKRLVRDRRHTDLYKIRRFALMVGYVFVRDPHDWGRLAATHGVSGVVRSSRGGALPMSVIDMLAIRAVEAEYDAVFDVQSKLARQKLRKKAKNDPRLKKLIAQLDTAGTVTVPIDSEIFESVA
ncbi:MAG: hypothetical protein H6881_09780 [Rhodobiaceae bacterium]|nr:hypothetical protein [Rhodobiaceae bacterium]